MRNLLPKKLLRRIIFAVLAGSVVAAILLAVFVRNIGITKFDIAITEELQENTSRPVDFLMRAISATADPIVSMVLITVVAVFLMAIQRQREALFLLVVPFADIFGSMIKNIVARPRPSEFIANISTEVSGSSFPSGHVIHAVIFFGYLFALSFVIKELPTFVRWIVATSSVLIIILMSVSRIYLGAHWASDVIGGYLIGFPMLAILLLAYFHITRPSQL